MDDSVVVATRRGIVVQAKERIAALREEFAQRHAVRFRRFLDRDLLDRVQDEIDSGAFAIREDEGIAIELCLEPSRALDILMFVMNTPQMFDVVRAISGCAPIEAFAGRIYRFDPAVHHRDSWHDDTSGAGASRLAGFSLNLSRRTYCGGTFQIREKGRPDDIVDVDNTGAGGAFLFCIAPQLQHRVLPVEGTNAKTAFAGWFVAK